MTAYATIPGDWPAGTVAVLALPLPADVAGETMLQLGTAYPGAVLGQPPDGRTDLLVAVVPPA